MGSTLNADYFRARFSDQISEQKNCSEHNMLTSYTGMIFA